MSEMDLHDLLDWHVESDACLDAGNGAGDWNAVPYTKTTTATVSNNNNRYINKKLIRRWDSQTWLDIGGDMEIGISYLIRGVAQPHADYGDLLGGGCEIPLASAY